MSDNMNDLFKGLQMFQQGAQELAIGRAMRSAAEQAQQINLNETNEMKKRQQLTQMGTQLALHLGGLNAPVSQIQSAVGSFMPQALNSPEAFFTQAAQSTDPNAANELNAAGRSVQRQIAAAPLTTAQQETNKLGYAQLLAQSQAAATTAAGEKAPKTLTTEEKKLVTDTENDLTLMNGLLRDVETDPSLVGPKNMALDTFGLRGIANPKFDVFKKQVMQRMDAYRQRITGAGASDAERKVLESRLPQLTDTPTQFVKNMKASIAIGERVRKRTLENYGKAKSDISGFNLNPITTYGKQMQTLEPVIQRIEAAQTALSKLLVQQQNNPSPELDAKIQKLRDRIELDAKEGGI